MRRANCVEISGEVEVDFLHGYDLAVTATGCASFDPEDWSETGLTQA